MQINVAHKLQIFDPTDPSLDDKSALVLPIAEARAAMGETVAAYLARVAWRFDLPTVCRINGEFYARAEWETRALAVNDNIEFISRPLGGGSSGGSTGKSIMSVVALVALTALAPYAVAGLGIEALGTAASALTWGGKVAAAAIVGAGALAISHFLAPKAGGKSASTDALYSFGLGGNQARPMQPIPVLNGRRQFAPDFAAPTYSECVGDTLTDYGDGHDGTSRLRPRQRGARAYRWAASWSGRIFNRHAAKGTNSRASAGGSCRTWAERFSGIFRRSSILALCVFRRCGRRHA